jgi:hypothetical protein
MILILGKRIGIAKASGFSHMVLSYGKYYNKSFGSFQIMHSLEVIY